VQPLPGRESPAAEARSIKVDYYDKSLMTNAVGLTDLTRLELQDLFRVAGTPGRVKRLTDHGGRSTEFMYDDDGYLKTLRQGDVVAPGGGAVNSTDRREFHLSYTGSGANRVLEHVVDPRAVSEGASNRRTTLSYEDAQPPGPLGSRSIGRRASGVTNRRAHRTAFSYPGGKFAATAPGARTTTYTLDGVGRTTDLQDGLGRRTGLGWDVDNNTDALTKKGFRNEGLCRLSGECLRYVWSECWGCRRCRPGSRSMTSCGLRSSR